MNKLRARSLIATGLFGVSLTLLFGLGVWQWQRGAAKSLIEQRLATNADSISNFIPLGRAPSSWSRLAHRAVQLRGDWLPTQTFLLANRTHNGILGYEVFSPYRLAGDAATLLVNRGWVDARRIVRGDANAWLQDSLRDPAAGILYIPQTGFTLGEAYYGAVAWPLEIQYLDFAALSTAFGAPLQPAAVALGARHPAAFTPIWRAVAISAVRHFGYAVQWWGLAVTLLAFGFVWRKRARQA